MANRDFGLLVKSRRESKDMTQEQLAAACGLSRGAIMHIERGNQRVFLDQALKIVLALEIPLSTITDIFDKHFLLEKLAEQPEEIRELIQQTLEEIK